MGFPFQRTSRFCRGDKGKGRNNPQQNRPSVKFVDSYLLAEGECVLAFLPMRPLFLGHAFAEPANVWFPFPVHGRNPRLPEDDQCAYSDESPPASIRSPRHPDTHASWHQAIGVATDSSPTIPPPRIRRSGSQHWTKPSAQPCPPYRHAPDSVPYSAGSAAVRLFSDLPELS
jgi:hypothetical protein